MFQLNATPGRTAIIDGKEYLFFSGYGYLGMHQQPEFLAHLQKAIQELGIVFPSSRISNTRLSVYEQMEASLSKLTDTADTVLFSSGYIAGKTAVQLFNQHRTVFSAPNVHPAIQIRENTTIDFDSWAQETIHYINSHSFNEPPVLICDAVNPLTASINKFSFLEQLNTEVVCIIDDSHGIGLLNDGKGISLPQKANLEYLITYSLSKAIHLTGGAVSCTNKQHAELLRKQTTYTTSTAPSPFSVAAYLESASLYSKQREQLQQICLYAAASLKQKGIQYDAKLPILILPEAFDEPYFRNFNIIISSFAYPNEDGKKINRAVFNALHTQQDINALMEAISYSL